MDFSHVNYLAVMLAAAASFIFGGVWYGIFSRQWMEAAGLKLEDIKPGKAPVLAPYITAYFAQLIMAFTLSGVILQLGAGHTNVRSGMLVAFMIWLGFIATSLVVNHAFQGARRALTFIDGGHWLGAMLVQGLVLGGMGGA